MARKQTRKKTLSDMGKSPFDYINDKMDFSIEREELSEVEVELEQTDNKLSDEKDDTIIEETVTETEDKTLSPTSDESEDVSEEELLKRIAERKKRTKPEKRHYSVPNADGSIPDNSIASVIQEKAIAAKQQSPKRKSKTIPKVAKTFKIPDELAEDLDQLFRDSNGRRISGTKGMMSTLVTNAIVEYLVSQGIKDKEYLRHLQEFNNKG